MEKLNSLDEVFDRWTDLSKIESFYKKQIINFLGEEETYEQSKNLNDLISLGFYPFEKNGSYYDYRPPTWILIRFPEKIKSCLREYSWKNLFYITDKMINGEIELDRSTILSVIIRILDMITDKEESILIKLEENLNLFKTGWEGLPFYKYMFMHAIVFGYKNIIDIYHLLTKLGCIDDENRPWFLSAAIISKNLTLFNEIIKYGPYFDETFDAQEYYNLIMPYDPESPEIKKEIIDTMYKLTDDSLKLSRFFIKTLTSSNLFFNEFNHLYKYLLQSMSIDEIGELISE